MKQLPSNKNSGVDLGNPGRRDVLRGSLAGMALAVLPGIALAQSAPTRSAAASAWQASVGYWQGGAALTELNRVRAGWMAPCASAEKACAAEFDDVMLGADVANGAAGTYSLRVIGMNGGENAGPLAIEAVYPDASHRLWQTWLQYGVLQSASPIAARWTSAGGEALLLRLSFADLAVREVALPARRGVYVLAMTNTGKAPRWRGMALRALDASRPTTLSLVSRGTGTEISAPHLLLTVV